jgi:hypothetical protein
LELDVSGSKDTQSTTSLVSSVPVNGWMIYLDDLSIFEWLDLRCGLNMVEWLKLAKLGTTHSSEIQRMEPRPCFSMAQHK